MIGIYKTLYSTDNKAAEYQRRGKTWYKRKKDSDDKWVKVEEKYYDNLNKQNSGFLFNYTIGAKIIAASLLAFVVYKVIKK